MKKNNKIAAPTVQLSIRVPQQTYIDLRGLSISQGRPLAAIIREAVAGVIEKYARGVNNV